MVLADGKVSAGQSPAAARLPAGYDQYPGRGPGKVEEEICLLDSRTAPRRKGNRQGPLGRDRSLPSAERMGPESIVTGEGGTNGHEELAPPFFYHLTPDVLPYGWEPYGIYERVDIEAIGIDVTPAFGESETLSRCFNCGDPDHKITECGFRLNRELISLARQYYQFHQGSSTTWKRIHSVEAWRQQRLDWLEEFEPGKIKGELLKEALRADYANEEEWLKNISLWGYPRGWVSESDPRERVRSRIWNENEGDVEDDLEHDVVFEIHGDGDVVETLSFRDAFRVVTRGQKLKGPSSLGSRSNSLPATSSSSSSPEAELIRWAQHPLSYFSSQHLVLYNPPAPREPWSNTTFEDTDAYLHQFYRATNPPPPPSDTPPPLPPSSTPPPLPPSFPPPQSFGSPPPQPSSPPPPPPPLQTSNNEYNGTSLKNPNNDEEDDLSEADMDFSDSD